MEKFLDFVDGKKTYLSLIAAAIIYSLKFWEVIDEGVYNYLMTLDVLLLGGAIRSAFRKIEL